MSLAVYRADCSRCCGLCCVVPAQLREQGFGTDKPAHSPCVHLDQCNRCAIHRSRRKQGYAACESFDCFGAGQWVTQHLFEGASWADAPGLGQQMFAAYRHWLPRFEAAALIEAALPHVHESTRPAFLAKMMALTFENTDRGSDLENPGELKRLTLAEIRSALLRSGR